jgi:abhydrolase domain-containing protein 1/3
MILIFTTDRANLLWLIPYRLILGNYLASQFSKPDKPISAAMVISVPWNVFKGTESIEKPIVNLMLNRHLAGGLCKNIER